MFLIMFLAFVVRICLLGDGGYSPDSREYYGAAINIVNGNGYSICHEPPFYPFYYREPLTSYVMAFVIWAVNLFYGVKSIDYPHTMVVPDMPVYHQTFIYSIRIFSILLQLISIYLFYKIVRRKSNDMYAIVFLLLCALSLPMIISLSLVLREPYVFFLLSLILYFWSMYLDNRKLPYILLVALTNGVLCLCFQLYWFLSVIILLILLWILRKNILVYIKLAVVYVVFFFMPLIPHLIQVYHYYPDVRILRTLGSALTYECNSGHDAYEALGASPWSSKDGDLPNGLKPHPELFDPRDAAKLFERSFDGTYAKEVERLNSVNSKGMFPFYLDRTLLSLRNTIFMVGITYDYGVFIGQSTKKDIAKFLVVFPYLLCGILGLIGLCPFLKKYWMFVPVFLFHSLLFFILGDEERRQVMLVPYLICIVMFFIGEMIKRKRHCLQKGEKRTKK